MATTMLFLLVILLVITAFPWLGKQSHAGGYHTDLMAGDEGDD